MKTAELFENALETETPASRYRVDEATVNGTIPKTPVLRLSCDFPD